ncbi:MAG TPA: hypothetical protein QF611_03370 [Pseudomonadales bacterium]|nr:hypothetical protein [Pseudomonadales bacterium]MDP7316409.1 hypothetical protein [Pseudomonadales bacterium]HJP50050.1 hypothetical protein [Pseudomonadales bacterium]
MRVFQVDPDIVNPGRGGRIAREVHDDIMAVGGLPNNYKNWDNGYYKTSRGKNTPS